MDMKCVFNVIICVLALINEGWSEYGDRIKNATVIWGDNLQMEESRHGGYAIAPPPTELPVTFQAPYINAQNYWSNSDRRTVLDYQPYVPQDIIPRPITEGINTFYGLMNQFFGTEAPARRPPPPHQHPSYQGPVRQQRPDFDYPYHPQNIRPFYLPGPKPLRASIQKLEPPRNNFPPAERPNNYPHFIKILNDVLLENSYTIQEPPVIEKPVYEYESIVPTTYKPNIKIRTSTRPSIFPVSIQDQLPPVQSGQDTRIPYVTETTTVQSVKPTSASKVVFPINPEPIQPLDFSIDVRNANSPIAKRIVSTLKSELANTTIQPPTTPAVEVTTDGESGIKTSEPTVKSTTEKLAEVINVANQEESENVKLVDKQKDNIVYSTTESSFVTTTSDLFTTVDSGIQPTSVPSMVTGLLDTMEPLQNDRTRSQFPKKLHSRKVTTDATNSADYVTDLTLQGLNDSKAVHVSVPKRFKPFNMSLVLNYVIGELNATAPPLNVLPIDDGLSLDAKILKDTNWDGYQPVIPTTEESIDTTTIWTPVSITTDVPIKETTEPIRLEEESTTISPRSKRLRIVTTTPIIPISKSLWTTTIYPTETTTAYPTTTEVVTAPAEKQTEIIATRVTQSVSKSLRQRQRSRTTTEEPAISPRALDQASRQRQRSRTTTAEPTTSRKSIDQENSSTELSSMTRKGRKYQRKPKSQSFTQFSNKATTQAPLKLGTISKPFYPKRSRSNSTITFNNRGNNKVSDNSEEKGEKKIVLPAEETTTRKNLYKRRKYPSQIRKTSTEESLVQS